MKIIRARDLRTTPWKNGGGSTSEIAVMPADASLEDFDWRISMAHVASDGPFSVFPGIDRTLAIVKGEGLMLTIGDDAPRMLDPGSDPISFPGDVPVSARLTKREIADLNVMTRRRRFSHFVQKIRSPTLRALDDNETAVVLSFNGSTTLTSGQEVARLDHADVAILSTTDRTRVRIEPATSSDCYLVLLHKHEVS
jgi:hypothetical protein